MSRNSKTSILIALGLSLASLPGVALAERPQRKVMGLTPSDVIRLAKAEEKRQRKAARRIK